MYLLKIEHWHTCRIRGAMTMKLFVMFAMLGVGLMGCAANSNDASEVEVDDADFGAQQNPFIECTFTKGGQQAKVSFAKNKPRAWNGTVLGAQFEVGMSANHLETLALYADGKRQITHNGALYPKDAQAVIASAARDAVSVTCSNATRELFPKDDTWSADSVYTKAPKKPAQLSSAGYVLCSGSADITRSDTTDVYFRKSNVGAYTHTFPASKASVRMIATATGLRDIRMVSGNANCTLEAEASYRGKSNGIASCGGGRYLNAEAGWGTYAGSIDCTEMTEDEFVTARRLALPERTFVEIFPAR
jgi:hypothetical protein